MTVEAICLVLVLLQENGEHAEAEENHYRQMRGMVGVLTVGVGRVEVRIEFFYCQFDQFLFTVEILKSGLQELHFDTFRLVLLQHGIEDRREFDD